MPAHPSSGPVGAVIFDLDGLLVETEQIWDAVRRDIVATRGGTWAESATRDMMGMSTPEWSAYMHDRLGVPLPQEQIAAEVTDLVAQRFAGERPLLPGARSAVLRLAHQWPLGIASSSPRTIIERFLDTSGLRPYFAATVSSEEVAHGKPAPDVYLTAAAQLGAPTSRCVAVEDSTNGIRSAAAASMTVIAVPNRQFPPTVEALALAALVVPDLESLTPERVEDAVLR